MLKNDKLLSLSINIYVYGKVKMPISKKLAFLAYAMLGVVTITFAGYFVVPSNWELELTEDDTYIYYSHTTQSTNSEFDLLYFCSGTSATCDWMIRRPWTSEYDNCEYEDFYEVRDSNMRYLLTCDNSKSSLMDIVANNDDFTEMLMMNLKAGNSDITFKTSASPRMGFPGDALDYIEFDIKGLQEMLMKSHSIRKKWLQKQ